jgi:hypothetical protein
MIPFWTVIGADASRHHILSKHGDEVMIPFSTHLQGADRLIREPFVVSCWPWI